MKIKVEDIKVGDTLFVGVINPTPYLVTNIVTEPVAHGRIIFHFQCTFKGKTEYEYFNGRTVDIKDR